jgi:hypothetical protein
LRLVAASAFMAAAAPAACTFYSPNNRDRKGREENDRAGRNARTRGSEIGAKKGKGAGVKRGDFFVRRSRGVEFRPFLGYYRTLALPACSLVLWSEGGRGY